MKKEWKQIADSRVRHVWACPECKDEDAVAPDFYQDNGTPVCPDCDCDMEYVRTETK